MYLGTGGITINGLHEIHKETKRIADALKSWSGSDGLQVMTGADRERRRQDDRPRYLSRDDPGAEDEPQPEP